MKKPQLMIQQLNTTIDLLEESGKTRRQLIDTLLDILDERDTAIDDLNCEIKRLKCRIEAHGPTLNVKRAD